MLQGIAVPLTAYGILCVRLTSLVHLPAPPEVQHSIHGKEFDFVSAGQELTHLAVDIDPLAAGVGGGRS